MRSHGLTLSPLVHSAAVALLGFASQFVSGHYANAQPYYIDTKEGNQRLLDARRTIQTEREKEVGRRNKMFRDLDVEARAHVDELSVIGCSTAGVDKWSAQISKLNEALAKLFEAHTGLAQINLNKARTFPSPYKETYYAAANEDATYAKDFSNFMENYMESQVAARLTFADGALRRGCIDLADAEYRKTLQLQHIGAKFSNRAMVGIQDVRDARARLAPASSTTPNVEICTDGKPRHWSQSIENCRSR